MEHIYEKYLENTIIVHDGKIFPFKNFVYPSSEDDDSDSFGFWYFMRIMKNIQSELEAIESAIEKLEESQEDVCYMLVNSASEMTKTCPTRKVFDMNLIYFIVLKNYDNGFSAIYITNEIAKEFGISEEQLYKQAKKITPKKLPLDIEQRADLTNLLYDESGEDFFSEVNVFRNKYNIYGAVSVFYEGALENFSEENISGNIVIIPSTENEMLVCITHEDIFTYKEELNQLMGKLNERTALLNIKLSDSILYYDRTESKIRKQ